MLRRSLEEILADIEELTGPPSLETEVEDTPIMGVNTTGERDLGFRTHLVSTQGSTIELAIRHANHMYIRLVDSAALLNMTIEEVRELRRSEEYLAEVRRRIERNSREELVDRMERWVTRIDRVYSRYFGVPIEEIRHILECIFPAWSEFYNDRD